MQHLQNFDSFINESEELNENAFLENPLNVMLLAKMGLCAVVFGIAGAKTLVDKIKKTKADKKLLTIISSVEGLEEKDQETLRELAENYMKEWSSSAKGKLISKMKDLLGEESSLSFVKMLDKA